MKEAPMNIPARVEVINGIRVEFSRVNGLWQAKPLDKGGATGNSMGGRYESMDAYIAKERMGRTYNDAFHSGVPREDAKRIANPLNPQP